MTACTAPRHGDSPPETEAHAHLCQAHRRKRSQPAWRRRCMAMATGRYRWACVHEHMADRWLCTRCATTSGLCQPCLDAGHECRVAWVPLSHDGTPQLAGASHGQAPL